MNFKYLLVFFVVCYASKSLGESSAERHSQSENFDFVIVGGGTAGCVLANRLTESGEYNVLVLEAGGIPDPGLDVPATFTDLYNSTYVKFYRTVPQKEAGLVEGGIINYVVGRTLGGGSQVNAMNFNRGSPFDYDNWARITGDPSWRYANLLKYFRRIEDYQGDFPSDQHGYGGPITISRPRYSPGLNEWLDAGRYLGYTIADPNGFQRISFTPMEYSKRRGRRVSAYAGYLKPILSRPNLRVITNAEVTKLIFEGNRVTGVVYTSTASQIPSQRLISTRRIVRAQKEVILSAGTLGTPAIMMRSGVGPKDVLAVTGIPPVKYLPVGMNLHDHPTVMLEFIINNRSSPLIEERDLNPETWRYFNEFGDGPYSCFSGITGQAFLPSSLAHVTWNDGTPGNKNWADLHLLNIHSTEPQEPGTFIRDSYVLSKDEVVISGTTVGARPKSRGRLTLNVTNPDSDPLVDFRFYENLDDLEVMLDGLKTTLRIHEETPSYRRLGARLPPNPHPGCLNIPFRSDNYFRCVIKQQTRSIMHATGTMRMGRGGSDPKAVVNSRLNVIGFENLRVCDGSIMPQVTNANTQAAVYVIAEKTADVIVQRWERYGSPGKFKSREFLN